MVSLTDYLSRLGKVESNNNPYAKSPTSSASGTYQFTKGTWESLGYNWADRFDPAKQHAAASTLTNQNSAYLSRNGVTPDAGSLYGAHFLGAGKAARVYNSDNSSPLVDIVGRSVIKANPFLENMNVGDFKNWAAKKMTGVGDSVKKAGDVAMTAGKVGLQLASGDAIGAAKTASGNDSGGILKQLLDWLKGIFSANTAARFAAIIVGVVLIAGAIYALSGVNKFVMDAAKTTAKAVI